MSDETNGVRKARKLGTSRDRWKQRAAEKQEEIRQLRGKVRDLIASRDGWRTRAKAAEQQLRVLQTASNSPSVALTVSDPFFGG
jgi:predicted  nucleic acid-binding Zn-ribbon protein